MALVYRHKPITRTDRNYLLVDSPQLSVTSSLVYQYTSIPVHHSPFTIIPLHHYTNQQLTTDRQTDNRQPKTLTIHHSPLTTHYYSIILLHHYTKPTTHHRQTENWEQTTDNRQLRTHNRQLKTENWEPTTHHRQTTVNWQQTTHNCQQKTENSPLNTNKNCKFGQNYKFKSHLYQASLGYKFGWFAMRDFS